MSEEGIEILLTADRNLPYQQNLDKYKIRVVVLLSYDNRYKTLASHIPTIEAKISGMKAHERVLRIDLRK